MPGGEGLQGCRPRGPLSHLAFYEHEGWGGAGKAADEHMQRGHCKEVPQFEAGTR